MKSKNILLFLTDGQRRDTLSCYDGRVVKTPCVDQFAREGLQFTQAFSVHTVCMPTRASIYTGRYPHVHGVWANGVPLPRSEVTLPQVLAEHGYATCATGKIHFEPQQSYAEKTAPIMEHYPYYGFQEVHLTENVLGREYLQFVEGRRPDLARRARQRDRMPEELHELYWITSQAIGFVERSARGGKPFFCHCSFHELIPPSHPPENFIGRHRPEEVIVPESRPSDLEKKPPFYRKCYEGYCRNGRQPDEQTLREYIASAYDQAVFIDKQFGRIVDALKRLGIWEDTIVMFTTDHGLSLNDHYQWAHGPFLFDTVINIPMIWRVPGTATTSRTTDEFVEQVDIMPTILELCGIEAHPAVQGQSIVPILRGKPGARGRPSVLIQDRQSPDLALRGLDPASVTQIGIRTKEWKLIHYPGCPYGELYDLRNDPGEFENLWGEPSNRAHRGELEHLLMERLCAAQPPVEKREYDS